VPLTDVQIRTFKCKPSKSVKLFDGRGLYLEVTGTGSRWWRLKYRYAGKEKRLSLGVYPETSLKEARDRCDEARQLLMDGVDLSQQRQVDKLATAERAENIFEKIGREWFRSHRIIRHSLLCSSIRFSIRTVRPSCVQALTKS
jgi:hypothetical protein